MPYKKQDSFNPLPPPPAMRRGALRRECEAKRSTEPQQAASSALAPQGDKQTSPAPPAGGGQNEAA